VAARSCRSSSRREEVRVVSWVREHTLCRLGVHCRPGRRVRKYDGGRLPLLCCYCYEVVGYDHRLGGGWRS
jgi:hypothetical protein